MIYFPLLASTFHLPDVQTSEPEEFRTWVWLSMHCAQQHNDGIIRNAKGFTNHKWLMGLHVDPKIVKKESPLWRFDGDDLIVSFYPKEQQDEFLRKSAQAKAAARKSVEVRQANAQTNAPANAEAKAQTINVNNVNKETTTVAVPEFDEVQDHFVMGKDEDEIDEANEKAQQFFDQMEASGWKDATGKPIGNWRRYAGSWKPPKPKKKPMPIWDAAMMEKYAE